MSEMRDAVRMALITTLATDRYGCLENADEVTTAVIAAMRELPDSLWEDGGPLDPEVIGYDLSPTAYWEAIIDAALKSSSGGITQP